MTGATADPLLKWPGGKRLLASTIAAHAGTPTTWVEPFVGAGGAWLTVGRQARRSVVADVNPRLINLHRVVRDLPNALIDEVRKLPYGERTTWEPAYVGLRDEFNAFGTPCPMQDQRTGHDVRNAALLLWLNKACFNGVYRENRAGQFNVSPGRSSVGDSLLTVPDAALIHVVSQAIQSSTTLCTSFTDLGGPGSPADNVTIYCDPPYLGTFSSYARRGFDQEDHRRLVAWCEAWAASGATVLVSNSAQAANLYEGWDVYPVHDVRRSCGGTNAARGLVSEIIAVAPRPDPR